MSVVVTVKNVKYACYYKHQHLPKADSSVICKVLVGSKHGPGVDLI
jgi:hypothetical protein